VQDIEPKGFRLMEIDGFVTREVVRQVQRCLTDHAYRREMVDYNYKLGRRFYSYSVLRRGLRTLLTSLTGWAPEGQNQP